MEHNISIKELNLLKEDASIFLTGWRGYIEKINKKYDADIYNEDFIKSQKEKALEDYVKAVHVRRDSMLESIDNIIKAEQENESVFDINNPTLQSAINIVSTLGEKASYQIADNIIKSLRGDHYSLQIIKKEFEQHGVKTLEATEKYFSQPSVKAEEMKKALTNYMNDTTNISKLKACDKAINEYADLIGVTLEEDKFDLTTEEFTNTAIRSAMGLE